LRIKFSKKSEKFLEKITPKRKEVIRLKLKRLWFAYEEGRIPFQELKIKKLEGKWKGYFRMRTDGIRVIYRIDKENNQIFIYDIDSRGNIY
jgi:mRNA interferase RelE/StbE